MPWCDGVYRSGFNSCAEYNAYINSPKDATGQPRGYTAEEMGPLPTGTGTFLPGGIPAPPEDPASPDPIQPQEPNMVAAPYRTGVGGGSQISPLTVAPMPLTFNPYTPPTGGGGYTPPVPTGGGLGGLAQQGCGLITNPTLRALCEAGVNAFTGSGGPGPATDRGNAFANPGGACAPGYEVDASGNCVESGLSGTVHRALPGGSTGTQAGAQGQAVIGAFGLPAMVPMQVGTVTRNDGGVSPILRCMAGYKLGADNLCYVKGTRGVHWKYKTKKAGVYIPGAGRITKKDVDALKAHKKIQKAAKGFATAAGMSCKRR